MHEGKNYQDFLKWEVVFRSFSYNNELKGFFLRKFAASPPLQSSTKW